MYGKPGGGHLPGSHSRSTETVERYLRKSTYEPDQPAWPGNVWDRARRGRDELLAALVPAAEREAVLALLERSVVFLTDDNIERVLLSERWLHTAWSLANLYLSSVDAELLGPEAPSLLGLSAETTCYVSADYFGEQRRFDDYVIHEVAHVFQNWKRRNTGLRETRTREWLLELEFKKRETFAYSCEAYGWIVEHARSRQERIAMGQQYAAGVSRFQDEDLEQASWPASSARRAKRGMDGE